MVHLRKVVGDSMLPTYSRGQIVLFVGLVSPRIGDVILFEHEGIEKIKRVKSVNTDRLYVLGDNQSMSTDSRTFGQISRKTVKGVAIFNRFSREETINH